MRLTLVFATAALSPLAAAQNYIVTELTTPPGFSRAIPQDLTDSGRALVIYENSTGGTRTFLWDHGAPTDLGVFQGLARTEGNGVNESGIVIGSSWAATGFPAFAWKWQNGVFTNLGSIGGYANGGGINEGGQSVGWASTTTAGFGGSTMAFFHDGTSMKRLGHTASGHYTDASAVNAAGQTVGNFVSERRNSLDGAYLGDLAGGLHELPTLGGLGAFANAINDAGWVVGSSETGAADASGLYHLRAFLWADGVMKDLGTLPGQLQSGALGLNNGGDIVGVAYSDSSSSTNRWAVLWPKGGAPIDLNTRIPPGSGVHLTGASDVNASGQVLASGVVGSETVFRAYLITPGP
jgi:probable HAF family extracellular repeat protein